MTICSSPLTIHELCNLMGNHRTGVTVRHAATEEIPGVTYLDFMTSDNQGVSVVMERQQDGWVRYAMRVDGYGWTGLHPVMGS